MNQKISKEPTLRVLHLIGGGEIGGAEQHILTLLPRLADRGIQPFLGCLYSRSPLAEKIQTETTVPAALFPMKAPFDLRPLPRLQEFCGVHTIDLIHSHGLRANVLGRTLSRVSRIPSVTTWHSWVVVDFPGPLKGKIALLLERMTLKYSSGSIAISQNIASHLENWPPMQRRLNINKSAINASTIYNGYAPLERTADQHLEARRHYRSLWNIPEEALVLGTIGRLHPQKGHPFLVEAVSTLAATYPEIHLLIIGEGPRRPLLEKSLSNVPFPFTLAGYLPDAEQALPAMDMFLFPSVDEGMGIVLLEAIQAQLPIVATTAGGIPEVLRQGTDALLVPPADSTALAEACQRLLENPNFKESLIASSRERLSLFNPENMADQTIDFYKKVLGRQD